MRIGSTKASFLIVQRERGTCQTKQYASGQGMATRKVSPQTGANEEVCPYVEFKHYDPGLDTGNGKND